MTLSESVWKILCQSMSHFCVIILIKYKFRRKILDDGWEKIIILTGSLYLLH